MSGLGFVHPEFLWAFLACAVPIIVHFLSRRQSRRLDFSTIRFFPAAAAQTSRIRAIRRWLLLLTRVALVCVLMAIFARPFNKKDPFSVLRSPDAAIFAFVDPTISMDYRDNGIPLYARAFGLLDTLNQNLPLTAQRFMYNEQRGEFSPVKRLSPPPGRFTRHGAAPVSQLFSALDAARRRNSGLPVLVCVSDFQENVSRLFDTALVRRRDVPVLCVCVAPGLPWNFGVRDVVAPSANRSVVTARVSCLGRAMDNVGVSVFAGGMRIGHSTASAAEGSTAAVPVTVTSDVQNQGKAVVLDSNDPFADDDSCFFVQSAAGAARVLVAGEARECFPVYSAFRSLGWSQWNAVMRESRSVTYDDIDSATLIVLCGVRQMSSSLSVFLHGASFGKKAVLFSPVVDSAAQFSNDMVLPAWAVGKLRPVYHGAQHAIVLPDTVSALLAGFHMLSDADVAVRDYFTGLPGDVLLRLDNSVPFATHAIDSIGNSWVLLAVSTGLEGGDVGQGSFPASGLFVPLMDRLARYSLAAIQKEPVAWIAGLPRRNPYYGARRGATVFDAAGRAVMRWSTQPRVVFDWPGIYRIQPDNETGSWISVGMDTLEAEFSNRAPRTDASRAPWFEYVKADRFSSFVKNQRATWYSALLWIALGLLIVAEVLLWERGQKGKG